MVWKNHGMIAIIRVRLLSSKMAKKALIEPAIIVTAVSHSTALAGKAYYRGLNMLN